MRISSLLVAALLATPPVWAQSWPDRQTQTVSDTIEIIDRDAETRIRQTLERMREEEGVEMTLVTIDALSDFEGGADVAAYARGLFEAWKIGETTGDDGVLVLFVRGARELRVELGPAWPASAQEQASRVIDAYFVPDFRSGAYARGLETGTAELARRLAAIDLAAAGETGAREGGQAREATAEATTGPAPATSPQTTGAETEGGSGVSSSSQGGSATQAPPPEATSQQTADQTETQTETQTQTETAADTTAAAGADGTASPQAEPTGGGLSWLWLLGIVVAGFFGIKLLGRAPKCPECGKRGVKVTRDRLKEPTEEAEGQEQVTRTCPACGHSAQETRSLPRKDKPQQEKSQEEKPKAAAPATKGDEPPAPKGGGASGKW